jgi:hypothetical protein
MNVMINYQKALIYYITKTGTENLYIGSTTDLRSRKYVHKHRCNNKDSEYYDDTIYRTIRAHGGWDTWSIGVLQKYPCDSRHELQDYERYLIRELGATLNGSLPSTAREKYKEL